MATFVSPDEKSCLEDVRYLMSFLPSNNLEEPPGIEPTDDPERLCESLRDLLPASPNQPYDMKKVITARSSTTVSSSSTSPTGAARSCAASAG